MSAEQILGETTGQISGLTSGQIAGELETKLATIKSGELVPVIIDTNSSVGTSFLINYLKSPIGIPVTQDMLDPEYSNRIYAFLTRNEIYMIAQQEHVISIAGGQKYTPTQPQPDSQTLTQSALMAAR